MSTNRLTSRTAEAASFARMMLNLGERNRPDAEDSLASRSQTDYADGIEIPTHRMETKVVTFSWGSLSSPREPLHQQPRIHSNQLLIEVEAESRFFAQYN